MAIEGKIVTLTETATGSGLFPRTKTSAITNNEGVNLEVLLQNAGGNSAELQELKQEVEEMKVYLPEVKTLILSADEFNALTELDENTLYYVYE